MNSFQEITSELRVFGHFLSERELKIVIKLAEKCLEKLENKKIEEGQVHE